MKEVYVIRHGKSSWEIPEWSDEERPLRKKGKKRTQKVAKYLKKKGIVPQLILTSPAKRAKQTAKILREVLGEKIPVRTEKILYTGDEDDMEALLYGLDDKIERVFVVGHNPDLTDWVNKYKDEKIFNFPTSAVFGVGFYAKKWPDLPWASYQELLYVEPKRLK
ncbi:MAG: phosphohistidine phosphatase SixA [Chlorobi bacterium]|nr:phosphohistidine phosphatase SixA [Chlorobiota bacterium]